MTIDGEPRVVVRVQDGWLSQDEWWRPVPIDRLYFVMILETGRYKTIFRDRRTDRWYEQHHELT